MHTNRYFKQSATSAIPSDHEKDAILYHMELAYDQSRWTLPDDFMSRDGFERSLKRVDMTSSPGWPYCKEKPTNGEWLRHNGLECDRIQVERLWYDTQTVLNGKWDNYLKTFVKGEPHKRTKVDEGRWRLIMAASLPVQMAWHMLFDYMNDVEIKKAYYIPSQQGLKLPGGHWKLYRQQWLHAGYDCGLDKSAWDWTAPYWALKLDLEFRFRMGRGRRMAEWRNIAETLFSQMFVNPVVILSDGSLWQQTVPGIMKSGCVTTISSNSHMQVMLHLLACWDSGVSIHPFPVACGDDTLQTLAQSSNLEAYTKYGVVVKQASSGLEFVGHDFLETGPWPVYMDKHIKKLGYVAEEILPQYLDSMARMYVHTPFFEVWQELAERLVDGLPLSKQAYLYWYDVSE